MAALQNGNTLSFFDHDNLYINRIEAEHVLVSCGWKGEFGYKSSYMPPLTEYEQRITDRFLNK